MRKTPLLLLALCITLSTQSFSQGFLWGVTEKGGTSNEGVLYKVNIDGTNPTIHKSMHSEYNGYFSRSSLIQASNGKLYGVTSKGGDDDSGVIFEIDPATKASIKKYQFTNVPTEPHFPSGRFVEAPNGKLYGTTETGGTTGYGTLYEFDPVASTITIKYTFNLTDGAYPSGDMIIASNGKIYGTTPGGGTGNVGVLFEFDIATSAYSKKIDMAPYGVANSQDNLVQSNNGKLYGVANQKIFEFDPTTNAMVIRSTPLGFTSAGAIAISSSNKIYGIGSGSTKIIYEYDLSSSSIATKYTFGTALTEGSEQTGIMMAADGNLYGVAPTGGTGTGSGNPGGGILYSFNLTTNSFTNRYNFYASTYYNPHPALLQASNGKFYGTTGNDFVTTVGGTVFEFDATSNMVLKLYDFSRYSIGRAPVQTFVKHSNGAYYGLNSKGGTFNTGVTFGVDLTEDPNTLTGYISTDFTESTAASGPGAYPKGGFALAANNTLIGVTSKASQYGYGSIFRFSPGASIFFNTTSTLYSFTFDHSVPDAQCGITLSSNGKMYGMTSKGGANGNGTIYEFNSTYTSVFDFMSGTTGATPHGNLVQASDGNMYGMTYAGGSNDNGTLFQFNPTTYAVTTLVDFNLSTTGASPRGSLIQASNGKLYGLTSTGGSNNDGVLFEFDPSTNTFTKHLDFSSSTSGANPRGSLFQSTNGKLYGTAYNGGTNGVGVLFEFDPSTNTYAKKFDFNVTNGANPTGSFFYDSYVPKTPQTITFNALPDNTFGDASFTLTATSSSGLPVAYVATPSNVVTVSGNVVTIVGAGQASIVADQAGNSTYFAAQTVVRNFSVLKGSSSIAFTSPAAGSIGSMPLTITKAGSGGVVSYSVVNGSGAAGVSGSTLYMYTAGTVNVTANLAADQNYQSATATQTVTIQKPDPVISITSASSSTFGNTVNLTVSKGGSTGAATWNVSGSGASVSGTTLSFTTAGTVTITVNVAADASYNAGSATQTFTMNKGNQSIIFSAPSTICGPGATTTLSAYSDKGVSPITFTSGNPSIASVSGNIVTGVSEAFVTIIASQAGDANYNAATPVTQGLSVSSTTGEIYKSGNPCDGWVTLMAGTGSNYSWGSQTISVYGVGTYSVTYTNIYGCSVYASIDLTCDNPCNGCEDWRIGSDKPEIADLTESDPLAGKFSLFPNPVNSELTIHLKEPVKDSGELHLIDLVGNELASVKLTTGDVVKKINTQNLIAGTYLLQINTGTKRTVKKIIVMH